MGRCGGGIKVRCVTSKGDDLVFTNKSAIKRLLEKKKKKSEVSKGVGGVRGLIRLEKIVRQLLSRV